MKIKGIVDEDFINYKYPSMYIGCHSCSFKCDKECGKQVCQNGTLANSPDIEIPVENLVKRYLGNNITKSVVFAGLEPFDDIKNVLAFILDLRLKNDNSDDVVIYTGYTEFEISQLFPDCMAQLSNLGNIIIKFGRYVPNQSSHYDKILGINLASPNQYGKQIS